MEALPRETAVKARIISLSKAGHEPYRVPDAIRFNNRQFAFNAHKELKSYRGSVSDEVYNAADHLAGLFLEAAISSGNYRNDAEHGAGIAALILAAKHLSPEAERDLKKEWAAGPQALDARLNGLSEAAIKESSRTG